VNGEQDRIALLERNYLNAALHSRALFRQDEFATRKIPVGLGQQNGGLQREGEIAVQVLMQAIEVAGCVLQQQRRGANLPGVMAKF
jgi:hypothetical protein